MFYSFNNLPILNNTPCLSCFTILFVTSKVVLGYIFYMILVVAIAVTAVFYNHLEINMGKSIRGFKSVLAWIHLIGMNIGGTALTMTMIFAGLIG
jgi:hypothetical protein